MKVAVGSANPVKVDATRLAFEQVWPDETWEVEGVKVDSGVSDQPMSDAESIKGATNRAKAALAATGADYGAGLEGGLENVDGNWLECGVVVIVDAKGRRGIGSTCRMEMPPGMLADIQAGEELGDVADRWFDRHNLKHKEGFFGMMTDGAIDRTAAYKDGIIFALTRFIRPELFD